jgi:hypothetical protein
MGDFQVAIRVDTEPAKKPGRLVNIVGKGKVKDQYP